MNELGNMHEGLASVYRETLKVTPLYRDVRGCPHCKSGGETEWPHSSVIFSAPWVVYMLAYPWVPPPRICRIISVPLQLDFAYWRFYSQVSPHQVVGPGHRRLPSPSQLLLPRQRDDLSFPRFPIKFWNWGSLAQDALTAHPWTNDCGQRDQILWLARPRSCAYLRAGNLPPTPKLHGLKLGEGSSRRKTGVSRGEENIHWLVEIITFCLSSFTYPPWSHPLGFCFFWSGEGSRHCIFRKHAREIFDLEPRLGMTGLWNLL